ncbi:MAG: YceD family protein [Verrucomicrobiota bacterium]
MPLLVNLRHLEEDNLSLQGELPVEELDLDVHDELMRAETPLEYDIEVQLIEHNLLVNGRLSLTLECQCARCLKPFRHKLEVNEWAQLLPLEGEEKVPVANDFVDLTPYMREDILLEFPQHPLCEADCRGLPKKDSGESDKTSDPSQQAEETSAWAELDKLKFK